MDALIILIPLSLFAVACAITIFFRMSNSGQFDDEVGPGWSVLLDDDRPVVSEISAKQKEKK